MSILQLRKTLHLWWTPLHRQGSGFHYKCGLLRHISNLSSWLFSMNRFELSSALHPPILMSRTTLIRFHLQKLAKWLIGTDCPSLACNWSLSTDGTGSSHTVTQSGKCPCLGTLSLRRFVLRLSCRGWKKSDWHQQYHSLCTEDRWWSSFLGFLAIRPNTQTGSMLFRLCYLSSRLQIWCLRTLNRIVTSCLRIWLHQHFQWKSGLKLLPIWPHQIKTEATLFHFQMLTARQIGNQRH